MLDFKIHNCPPILVSTQVWEALVIPGRVAVSESFLKNNRHRAELVMMQKKHDQISISNNKKSATWKYEERQCDPTQLRKTRRAMGIIRLGYA